MLLNHLNQAPLPKLHVKKLQSKQKPERTLKQNKRKKNLVSLKLNRFGTEIESIVSRSFIFFSLYLFLKKLKALRRKRRNITARRILHSHSSIRARNNKYIPKQFACASCRASLLFFSSQFCFWKKLNSNNPRSDCKTTIINWEKVEWISD